MPLTLGRAQPPIQWLLGVLSLGVERTEHERDHSLVLVPKSRTRGSAHPPPIRYHAVVLRSLWLRKMLNFILSWDKRTRL